MRRQFLCWTPSRFAGRGRCASKWQIVFWNANLTELIRKRFSIERLHDCKLRDLFAAIEMQKQLMIQSMITFWDRTISHWDGYRDFSVIYCFCRHWLPMDAMRCWATVENWKFSVLELGRPPLSWEPYSWASDRSWKSFWAFPVHFTSRQRSQSKSSFWKITRRRGKSHNRTHFTVFTRPTASKNIQFLISRPVWYSNSSHSISLFPSRSLSLSLSISPVLR